MPGKASERAAASCCARCLASFIVEKLSQLYEYSSCIILIRNHSETQQGIHRAAWVYQSALIATPALSKPTIPV